MVRLPGGDRGGSSGDTRPRSSVPPGTAPGERPRAAECGANRPRGRLTRPGGVPGPARPPGLRSRPAPIRSGREVREVRRIRHGRPRLRARRRGNGSSSHRRPPKGLPGAVPPHFPAGGRSPGSAESGSGWGGRRARRLPSGAGSLPGPVSSVGFRRLRPAPTRGLRSPVMPAARRLAGPSRPGTDRERSPAPELDDRERGRGVPRSTASTTPIRSGGGAGAPRRTRYNRPRLRAERTAVQSRPRGPKGPPGAVPSRFPLGGSIPGSAGDRSGRGDRRPRRLPPGAGGLPGRGSSVGFTRRRRARRPARSRGPRSRAAPP